MGDVLFNWVNLVAASINVWPTNQVSYFGNERGKNSLRVWFRIGVMLAGDWMFS